MAASKFLDIEGLKTLVSLVKGAFAPKTHNHELANISDVTATKDQINRLSGRTANRAAIFNGSGQLAESAVTSTELGYLDGVTSNVQTQLNTLKNNWNSLSQMQYGIIEGFSISTQSFTQKTVTFSPAFSSTPNVIAVIFSSSNTMNIGMLSVGVDRDALTRTGCRINYWNASGALAFTPSVMWIAIPRL